MAFTKKKSEEKTLEIDASMQGTMNFKDPVNLRINGKFDGNLDTRGSLTIGPSAQVTAVIFGDIIVIAGKVKGKVTARDKLVLLPTAVVEGEIFPGKLSILEGGVFDGKCTMLGEFLNIDELSRYLEVDTNSLNDWANQGKVPAAKEGNGWKFERKLIDSWIAAGKIGK